MQNVFISYSHKDKERVADLVRGLKGSRIGVWWDEDLPQGKTWDDQIESALQSARFILVVWSGQSVVSENVKDEAHYALEERKALPVRIEEVKLPYRWRRLQHLDLFARPCESNEKWNKVITTLQQSSQVGPQNEAMEATETGDGPQQLREMHQSIALPLKAIIPALLVLLSLITNVAGTLITSEGSYWPLLTAGFFGVLALAAAVWSVLPRARNAYS